MTEQEKQENCACESLPGGERVVQLRLQNTLAVSPSGLDPGRHGCLKFGQVSRFQCWRYTGCMCQHFPTGCNQGPNFATSLDATWSETKLRSVNAIPCWISARSSCWLPCRLSTKGVRWTLSAVRVYGSWLQTNTVSEKNFMAYLKNAFSWSLKLLLFSRRIERWRKVWWSGMTLSNITAVWHPRQQFGDENAARSLEEQALAKLPRPLKCAQTLRHAWETKQGEGACFWVENRSSHQPSDRNRMISRCKVHGVHSQHESFCHDCKGKRQLSFLKCDLCDSQPMGWTRNSSLSKARCYVTCSREHTEVLLAINISLLKCSSLFLSTGE